MATVGTVELARVVEVLRGAGRLETPVVAGTGYVGVGVLRCGACGGPLAGESDFAELAHLRSDAYRCPESNGKRTPWCARLSAPARLVDPELRAFALRRWQDPAFLERWRRRRLAEVDALIAEGLAIGAWVRDRRNARRLRGREVRDGLPKLGSELVDLVEQRAALAFALGTADESTDQNSLSGLKRLRFEYRWGYPMTYALAGRTVTKKDLIRLRGGRWKLRAHRAALEDRFWNLVAQSGWEDPGTAWSPSTDRALTQDWGGDDLNEDVAWRRELLSIAAEETRLMIHPTTMQAPWVHVRSGPQR